VGGIAHDEMADYYRLADVTVSIPNSDGTPMSVLESMACGTPVLVSRIPNYDTHYIEEQKTVLMADQTDPDAVATALITILQDRALAQRISAEAKLRVVESASYESQMSKMNYLYEEVLHKGTKKTV
jgi:glycosyltransferase involved in cell wall biosynthesis